MVPLLTSSVPSKTSLLRELDAVTRDADVLLVAVDAADPDDDANVALGELEVNVTRDDVGVVLVLVEAGVVVAIRVELDVIRDGVEVDDAARVVDDAGCDVDETRDVEVAVVIRDVELDDGFDEVELAM